MAETAMTSVLSKVAELAFQEGQVLLRVGDDIMLLRDRLEWLQAFVRDADRKRRLGSDDFTQVMVRQTRDVVFEAEDTIDEFFHKVDISDKQGWRILMKYMTGCTTQISVRHGLSGQIKRIIHRLDQLTEHRKEYTLGTAAPMAWTSSVADVVPWTDISRKLVGLETTKSNLERLLGPNRSNKLVYISILGESGIGKTTLMEAKTAILKSVVSAHQEKIHFDVDIYCIVPPNSGVDGVLKQLCNEAKNQIKPPPTEQNLPDLLREKRYIVVLGGISSKSMLNCLKASFPDNNNGSRVVLILEPENKVVADHAASLNGDRAKNSILKLGRLGKEDTGELFLGIVYGDQKSREQMKVSRNEQLEVYKTKVYDITEGLPLAVVVLSGLLRSKEMPVEWDAVLQQFMPAGEVHETDEALSCKDTPVPLDALLQRLTPKPELPRLSNRMAIERIFSASFDDLPHDLKTCFLYFAAFSKNTVLDPDQIVRMWVAEGFIKPEMGKTLEELGQEYLNELASRCLLQVFEYHFGTKMMVGVHSRLTRFLQSEAREASFIEVHDNTSVLAPGAVRRLSIQNDTDSSLSFGNIFPKMRSFICRVVDEPAKDKKDVSGISLLCGSKFLRLLAISGVKLRELPKEICDLIHLRYIAIDSDELQTLPPRIDRLINLQTLDIRKSRVESIVQSFWKIKTLRHVFANQLKLNVLKGEYNLQSLHGVKPAGQWIEDDQCPLRMMPNLRSLELDLHGFEAHQTALQNALDKLHLLQHLELKGVKIMSKVLSSDGVKLRCLESLVIVGTLDYSNEDIAGITNSLPNLAMFRLKASKEDRGKDMLPKKK